MDNRYEVGDAVISIAGHDKQKLFVVIKVCDAEYVMIADGKTRTIAKPKRKKVKHLKPFGETLDDIAEKLLQGAEVYDKHIKSALAKRVK